MSDQPRWGEEHWDEVGIELDTLAHDNPTEAIRMGLENDDRQRVLGAFRLLQASGQQPKLSFDFSYKLARLLEQSKMALDAARVYRWTVEIDLNHPDAPELIFRSARLLLGPAARPKNGQAMLQYMIATYPGHSLESSAKKMLDLMANDDQSGLSEALSEAAELLGETDDNELVQENCLYPPAVQGAKTFGPIEQSNQNDAALSTKRVEGWLGFFKKLSVVFGLVLVTYVVTSFTTDRYRSVDEIDPALLRSPMQGKVKQPKVIQVSYGDYRYTLTPKYKYSISALVVSKDDYTMLGLSRGNLFHMDLCMIWGNNVRKRLYKHKGLSFVHHGNVCYTTSRDGAFFNFHELSNTHILAENDLLRDAIEDVGVGDQVRLQGWLVDVAVMPARAKGGPLPSAARLKTSTSRMDTGMGACEILYMRDVQVLVQANVWSRRINSISLVLLLILGLAFILRLILLPVGYRMQKRGSDTGT